MVRTTTFKSAGLLAALLLGATAQAQDSFRIGFIDPLSGPGATAGEVGLKTWQYLAGPNVIIATSVAAPERHLINTYETQ